jgi:hypothetical protein
MDTRKHETGFTLVEPLAVVDSEAVNCLPCWRASRHWVAVMKCQVSLERSPSTANPLPAVPTSMRPCASHRSKGARRASARSMAQVAMSCRQGGRRHSAGQVRDCCFGDKNRSSTSCRRRSWRSAYHAAQICECKGVGASSRYPFGQQSM